MGGRLILPTKPIEPFNVLAFDPGGTTGWAQAILEGPFSPDDTVELKDIYIFTGELGPETHHREIHRFISDMHNAADDANPLEIVFEPFHFRQHLGQKGRDGKPYQARHKVELISCEYIGIIKLACAQLGVTYYDRFLPGEAKTYCPDKKLDMLGWLQTPVTPMRHRNDALRQLVKYLIVKRGVRHPLTSAWRQTV